MVKLRSHKDLKVWNSSVGLVQLIYRIADEMPGSEQYGLISQIQRAAVSIPSNIAEGYARRGTGEYLRFLSMAYGSAAELDTQLIIIGQVYKHIDTDQASSKLSEIQRMLYVLMKRLQN